VSEGDFKAAEEMALDPQMREIAESEKTQIYARLDELESELQKLLLPRDPTTSATYFLRCARHWWRRVGVVCGRTFPHVLPLRRAQSLAGRIISQSASDLGGYREVICQDYRPRRVFQTQV
jgi:peptide chain release factor 1